MKKTTTQSWIASLAALALLGALTAGCTAEASANDTTTQTAQESAATSVGDAFSDALLELRVRAALLEHLGVDGLGVGVTVAGSAVRLVGEVEDPANKMLAREATMAVEGVSDVRSRITVAEQPDEATRPSDVVAALENELVDAKLETRIKAKLVEELGRVAFDIEVEATDGTVSLRGEVPDDERRDIALELARETDGVESLHDLLTVAS